MSAERVLVTGAANGIGAAIARRCRDDGYRVVGVDREESANADLSVTADLSDPAATDEALRAALADGPITRLVNNVGTVRPATLAEQTAEDLDAVVALNLQCAMRCTQALLPAMTGAGFGRIVSLSSRAALGKELRTAYAASKAGLIGMTRVWALELGRHGITANALAPGPVATELFERANPPDSPRTAEITRSIPVGRLGRPEDIAQAAAFFLDERSGFFTGQTLYACGGKTLGVDDL